MRFIFLAVLLIAPVLQHPAYAESGNEFLRRCQADASGFSMGVCSAYPTGFADGMQASGAICIPENVENGQIKAVLIAYLNKRPSELHNSVFEMAFKAFREAWPCQK
jgi:hypothetical protein